MSATEDQNSSLFSGPNYTSPEKHYKNGKNYGGQGRLLQEQYRTGEVKLKPMSQIQPANCFINTVLLECSHAHSFMFVYGCFDNTTVELSSCNSLISIIGMTSEDRRWRTWKGLESAAKISKQF